jgi:Uma2 family endonuclease
LEALTTEEKKNFIPLCPDFIIELRSPIEPLEQLKEKMAVYIKNGLQLGWLIDPEEKQVFVYQATGQITHLENPTSLSGEPLLAGFVLDPRGIWTANF